MRTRKQKKKRTETKKMTKSKGKMRGGGDYQVTSPSELFFVDLNGRIILIRSHCYEAEWLVRKENFLVFRGGEKGGRGPGGGGRAEGGVYPLNSKRPPRSAPGHSHAALGLGSVMRPPPGTLGNTVSLLYIIHGSILYYRYYR